MRIFEKFPHLKVIKSLSHKRKAKVYLVGGFLRDYLCKEPKADFDFAVEENAIAFAESFARGIKGAFIVLDKEHGCARVAKKTPVGLVTYDFSDFRARTFNDDLKKRDFTVNTLYVDIASAETDKPLKDLIKGPQSAFNDIRRRTIKMASVKAFKDDPLRMMRAFSLMAQLKFKIEAKTLAKIKQEAAFIRNVSFERVRDELFKVFKEESAAEIIERMNKIGLLKFIMPQVQVMFACKQGGYHHLDVWPHSLETVRQLEGVLSNFRKEHGELNFLDEDLGGARPRFALIKLAALLHDIGKPATKKQEPGGRTSFHGHEHVGKNISREIAKQIKISTRERHALEDMVCWHLRPGYLSNFKMPSEKAIYRYFRDTKEEALSVLLLSMADQMSTRGPMTKPSDEKHHLKICRMLTDRYLKKLEEKPFIRLIGGNELIRNLKLKPSPLFGIILQEVEEAQVLGKIKTKKDALALARKLSKEKGKRRTGV